MDAYTADATVMAAARNYCVAEFQAGREPVFSPLLPGTLAPSRVHRLYESTMTLYMAERSLARLPADSAHRVDWLLFVERCRALVTTYCTERPVALDYTFSQFHGAPQ